jgi:hypothetical protein
MSTRTKQNRLLRLVLIGVILNALALIFYTSSLETGPTSPSSKMAVSTENPLQERHEEAFALRDGLEAFGAYLEQAGDNGTSILYTNFISHVDSNDVADLIQELRAQVAEGNGTAYRQLIQALLLVEFPVKLKPDDVRKKPLAAYAQARQLAQKATAGAKAKGLLNRGKEIAPQLCGSCHIFPPPSAYSQTVWAQDVFPVMEMNLGLRKWTTPIDEGWREVFAAHVLPDNTPISVYDWTAIQYYYLKESPAVLPPIKGRDPIAPTTSRFQAKISEAPIKPSVVMVKIDPKRKVFYAGDTDSRKLHRLGPDGKIVDQLDLGLADVDSPIHVTHTPEGSLVTTVGFLMNSDRRRGALVRLHQHVLTGAEVTPLLENLRRPTDLAVADLNEDGRDDLIICEHGYYLGRFCWWENTGDGYKPHELLRQAGSLNARIADFNGDKLPDIALITSQSREGIHLFMNEGKGRFIHHRVIENHPAWGNSHLEVVDFDGDGDLDLLATNGDNGDIQPPPLRPYHGIRLYLNNGHNEFKQAFFWPQNGAFGALPEDFDGDGDMDMLAIAYFPDYAKSKEESLVYLENQGDLKFKASTFPEVNIAGRWLVMDKGDLDGDGDTDVVLGAFNQFPGQKPHFVDEARQKSGAAILILKNTTR